MSAILPILFFLLAGMACGFSLRHKPGVLRRADASSMLAVYVLLFVLGAKLGGDAAPFARLPEFGGTALVLALCCAAGSVLWLWGAERCGGWLRFPEPEQKHKENSTAAGSPLMGTVRILAVFSGGIVLGRLGVVPPWLANDTLAEYALWLLVFTVGMGLGGAIEVFLLLRRMQGKLLMVPLLIVGGTATGAVAAGLIVPQVGVLQALLVGSGFGYYSLSSIMIGEAGHPALASIALLANIFRELLGILTAQLLARYVSRLAPVGVAGATAMDTCLPVISRFSGEQFVVVAVFSGMLLSLWVPFVVAFLLSL